MIQWSLKDIEVILKSSFTRLDCEKGFDFHELQCEFGGLQYLLTICPNTELVWLRVDIDNPNTALPQFEYSLRCNRIRTGCGGYDSEAIFFEFINKSMTIEGSSPIRLVIDSLPNNKLYIWSVMDEADLAFETGKHNENPSK